MSSIADNALDCPLVLTLFLGGQAHMLGHINAETKEMNGS
jgi:hypothetical protein